MFDIHNAAVVGFTPIFRWFGVVILADLLLMSFLVESQAYDNLYHSVHFSSQRVCQQQKKIYDRKTQINTYIKPKHMKLSLQMVTEPVKKLASDSMLTYLIT
jgi:hypothetical protein